MAVATSSALLGINYAASATTISNERARVARTRQVDVPSPPRATSRVLEYDLLEPTYAGVAS
uniref:Uncharacterized protein n=1 Tax=Oryza nivara TaxID=4536 RepID=A0A0E0H494_ORYNI